MSELSTTQLANSLERLALIADSGERIVLRHEGKPIAAIVSLEDLAAIEELEDLTDIAEIRAVREEIDREGTVPLALVRERLGL